MKVWHEGHHWESIDIITESESRGTRGKESEEGAHTICKDVALVVIFVTPQRAFETRGDVQLFDQRAEKRLASDGLHDGECKVSLVATERGADVLPLLEALRMSNWWV